MIKLGSLDLYIGSDLDYFEHYNSMIKDNPKWYVISAAKEPHHRDLLGYKGRAAPKDHPDYLYGKDGDNRLVLNLVDSDNVNYIPKEIIKVAVNAAVHNLEKEINVFLHCNHGRSRSPTIAFFIIKDYTDLFNGLDVKSAMEHFDIISEGAFRPNVGMLDFINENYNEKFYIKES